MNRRSLLIAASILAALSVAGNVWLLVLRKEKPRDTAVAPQKEAASSPALPSVDIDFSGTGLSDDAWKLSDKTPTEVKLEEPFKLEPAPPRRTKSRLPNGEVAVPDISISPKDVIKTPVPAPARQ